MNKDKYLPPVHPGEILEKDFLEPMNLSQNELARQIGVPPRRINEIVHGKRSITADTAIRLSKFFGTSAKLWIGLQAEYDLDCVIYAERIGATGRFDNIKLYSPKSETILPAS
jgi:addiction module HigA family antidote